MRLEDVFVCLYSVLSKYIVLGDAAKVCRVNKYLANHIRTSVLQSREFYRVFGNAPAGSPAQLRLYYLYRDVFRCTLLGLKNSDTELLNCADYLQNVIRLRLQPPQLPSYSSLPQTVLQYRTWLGMLCCYQRECQQHTRCKLILERLLDCAHPNRPWVLCHRTYSYADIAFIQLWKFEAQREFTVHYTEYPDGPTLGQDTEACTACKLHQYYLQSALAFRKWKRVLHHHLQNQVVSVVSSSSK